MNRNGRYQGPISKLVFVGFAIFMGSIVLSFLTNNGVPSQASFQRSLIISKIGVLGWVIIFIGILRSMWLRKKAASIQKDKEAAGLMGEVRTAQELSRLDSRYKVFNRFYLYHGGMRQEYDHVILGPNGIFHVESKNWSGLIQLSDHGVRRSVKGEWHDPVEQMYRHHMLLEALLRENEFAHDLVGILCFTNRNAEIKGHLSTFLPLRINQLMSAITNHVTKRPLTDQDISNIAGIITRHSEAHY